MPAAGFCLRRAEKLVVDFSSVGVGYFMLLKKCRYRLFSRGTNGEILFVLFSFLRIGKGEYPHKPPLDVHPFYFQSRR